MNNIETEKLKNDLKQYLNYSDEQVKNIGILSDIKLLSMKRDIEKIKGKRENTSRDRHRKNIIEKKVNEIFKQNPKLKEKTIIGRDTKIKHHTKPENIHTETVIENKPEQIIENKPKPKPKIDQLFYTNQKKTKKIIIPANRKPKILFISDVYGWAWWIKAQYLKKYLSEYYDIDVKCVLGKKCSSYDKIDQKYYDLYFTFGYSYIDFLYRVPKFKKITGITAHRQKNVIFPKMKMVGNVHANSILLLKELYSMGFKNAYYIPNGVDIDLFKPINPLRKDGELVIGHVGKECPAKGQREYILPAIQATNSKSVTNLRTWKDKIPHHEMPKIYNEMDVFIVASQEDGTPNPALEAAACGRPIISNRIGNMPELITDGHNGFIIPKKRGAYIDKINYLKNNRNELIRMGNNARKEIEKWDWKYMSRNYLKMFDEIFGINRDKGKYENIALEHLEKLQ